MLLVALGAVLAVGWLVAIASADLMQEFLKSRPRPSTIGPEEYEFDGIAYADLYSDLVKANTDQLASWHHYYASGKKEGRFGPRRFPTEQSVTNAGKKLESFMARMDERKVPIQDRTLVIYRVPLVADPHAIEALVNSIKIFSNAIALDPVESSSNFYCFAVIEGAGSSFLRYLPTALDNVGAFDWTGQPSLPLLELRMLDFLHGAGVTARFGGVFFSSALSRGPFLAETHGQWLGQFRQLLTQNNVGLAGATLSCESVPHVQDQAWAIHQSAVPIALRLLAPKVLHRKWTSAVRYHMQYLSVLVSRTHNISSIQYRNALKEDYFRGICLQPPDGEGSVNPVSWRDQGLGVLFLPWHAQVADMVHPQLKRNMQAFLVDFQKQYPDTAVFVPDTMVGGLAHDLSLQHGLELVRDVLASRNMFNFPGTVNAKGVVSGSDQVCLMVRSSYSQSAGLQAPLLERDYFAGFDHFIQSMLRQTDGNWIAYFFVTDNHQFSVALKGILAAYKDPRLRFMAVPRQFRPVFTAVDAGYTATDVALQRVLDMPHCGKISFTNADNVYGSDVIRRVREVRTDIPAGPRLVLAPLESRNFLYQDQQGRSPQGVGFQSVCAGLMSLLEVSTLGLAVQPKPVLGKIDLASLFLDRAQLRHERIFFNNFSHAVSATRYPCVGCQDGYFTHYLTQLRHWRYTQLAIDGVQSVVFHGPSPAWCVAAGMVWFGHPNVNKARCFSLPTVAKLKELDAVKHGKVPHFDWKHWASTGNRCLQYSTEGFQKEYKTRW